MSAATQVYSMIHHSASFVINEGTSVDGNYTCTKDGNTSSIRVIKQESSDLSYRVAVLYRGIVDGRCNWDVRINGKLPMMAQGLMRFGGSEQFVLTPYDSQTLEIQETDESHTESSWIDLSDEKTYHVYSHPPLVSERMEALVESGKFFQTTDDKKVDAVLHNRYLGIFLRARDATGDTDIFFAKDSSEFRQSQVIQTAHSSEALQVVDSREIDLEDSFVNLQVVTRLNGTRLTKMDVKDEDGEIHSLSLIETEEGNQITKASCGGIQLKIVTVD